MSRRAWLGGLLAVAIAAPLKADDGPAPEDARPVPVQRIMVRGGPVVGIAMEAAPQGAEFKPGEYWLGLECHPADAALRAHLKLPEGQGLVVHSVAPDSPAAKAGLKQYDVLVKAGGKPLGHVMDLVREVEAAKETKLALEIVREAKTQEIETTPAKRPEAAPGEEGLFRFPVPAPENPDFDAVRKWLEKMQPGEAMRFRFFQPGVVLPPGPLPGLPLPDGMSVSVTKSGDEPARVVVQKGDQKWEVTEKELDKLPDDVRVHVEHLLGRVPPGHGKLDRVLRAPGPLPGADAPKIERPLAPARVRADVQQQLDKQRQQLEKLQKQLDELKKAVEKGHPKPDKDGEK